MSKLRKFMVFVKLIMQDTIKSVCIKGLNEIVDMFDKYLPCSINVGS